MGGMQSDPKNPKDEMCSNNPTGTMSHRGGDVVMMLCKLSCHFMIAWLVKIYHHPFQHFQSRPGGI